MLSDTDENGLSSTMAIAHTRKHSNANRIDEGQLTSVAVEIGGGFEIETTSSELVRVCTCLV